MAKFLSWLIFIVVAIPLVVFAVTNRQVVTLELWPLPITPEMPLYLMVGGALVVGLLVGLLLGWLVAGKARRRARAAQRRADSAQHDIALLREQVRKLEEADHRREVANPAVPAVVSDKTPNAA